MNQYIRVSIKLLWSHVLFVILTLVFMPVFGWLIQKENGLLIFSCIISVLYFLLIYSDVWQVAHKDSKPYSTTKPYVLKGALFGLLASIITIILAVLFFIARSGSLNFDIINPIYRVWMSMFLGFFETYGQTFPWVFALVVLVLPLASFLGYLAGMYNFSIQEKIAMLFNRTANKNNTNHNKKS
ncbi:hypothetical protein [Petroclostridium xylanilyticum]|uniref:hypothetical protein n=1 Tax=Petroclostridium xylanilyticum TaxID=1792311 RepID=UPI000B9987E3|nr:hypothetical protein [Petroclostridium xylanilyticum]